MFQDTTENTSGQAAEGFCIFSWLLREFRVREEGVSWPRQLRVIGTRVFICSAYGGSRGKTTLEEKVLWSKIKWKTSPQKQSNHLCGFRVQVS